MKMGIEGGKAGAGGAAAISTGAAGDGAGDVVVPTVGDGLWTGRFKLPSRSMPRSERPPTCFSWKCARARVWATRCSYSVPMWTEEVLRWFVRCAWVRKEWRSWGGGTQVRGVLGVGGGGEDGAGGEGVGARMVEVGSRSKAGNGAAAEASSKEASGAKVALLFRLTRCSGLLWRRRTAEQ